MADFLKKVALKGGRAGDGHPLQRIKFKSIVKNAEFHHIFRYIYQLIFGIISRKQI